MKCIKCGEEGEFRIKKGKEYNICRKCEVAYQKAYREKLKGKVKIQPVEKLCKVCQRVLPIGEFYFTPCTQQYGTICKGCKK